MALSRQLDNLWMLGEQGYVLSDMSYKFRSTERAHAFLSKVPQLDQLKYFRHTSLVPSLGRNRLLWSRRSVSLMRSTRLTYVFVFRRGRVVAWIYVSGVNLPLREPFVQLARSMDGNLDRALM